MLSLYINTCCLKIRVWYNFENLFINVICHVDAKIHKKEIDNPDYSTKQSINYIHRDAFANYSDLHSRVNIIMIENNTYTDLTDVQDMTLQRCKV